MTSVQGATRGTLAGLALPNCKSYHRWHTNTRMKGKVCIYRKEKIEIKTGRGEKPPYRTSLCDHINVTNASREFHHISESYRFLHNLGSQSAFVISRYVFQPHVTSLPQLKGSILICQPVSTLVSGTHSKLMCVSLLSSRIPRETRVKLFFISCLICV